ncbi:MAG: hypothetical protein LH477_06235 [Nocardioides sp.]|nr:hypothetical protein [Nocardioides sp.]
MNRRTKALALLALPVLALPVLALPVLAVTSGSSDEPCAAPTITGTTEDDVLRGTEGPDVIDGLDGDDEIDGSGGDDVICGGAGRDLVEGGEGADRMHVDGDTLSFRGSISGIVLDLDAGTATGAGADQLIGRPTYVLGSEHDDMIRGTGERDLVYGYGGSDRISGGGGRDRLNGSGMVTDEDDVVDGNDLLRGGPGNDFLGGSAGDDVLRGGSGNDELEDGDGADVLRGGTDDDSLFSSSGRDDGRGGPGQDRFVYSMGPADDGQVLVGGPGRDLVEVYFGATLQMREKAVVHADLGRGVARAEFSRASVAIRVLGFEDAAATDGTWYIRGTNGPNDLYAFPNASMIAHGLGGNDSLGRGFLDDVLDGGRGYDRAYGPVGGRDRFISIEKIL